MSKEIVMLSPDNLLIDNRYQRPVNPALVSRIARHYSEALFSPLLVAQRGSSKYYVVDGQHRLEAAKELGLQEIPCFIYQNMSPSEEASLFVNQQVATCRLTPRDTYKANIFIGNPENIDVIIENTLHKRGHRIGVHEHDVNGWYAIVALRETVKLIGQQGLDTILTILNKLNWISGRASKSAIVLRGLSYAVKKGYSIDEIVNALLKSFPTPEEFIAYLGVKAKGRKRTAIVPEVMEELMK